VEVKVRCEMQRDCRVFNFIRIVRRKKWKGSGLHSGGKQKEAWRMLLFINFSAWVKSEVRIHESVIKLGNSGVVCGLVWWRVGKKLA
jgi:hypothetical protein